MLPSAEQEASDPEGADRLYEPALQYLIAQTRDREAFPLVFEENCNFGFRRNYWGRKYFGVALSGTAFMGAGGLIFVDSCIRELGLNLPAVASAALVATLFLVTWIVWITPDWVRVTGFAYADRLLESCDRIPPVKERR